MTEHIQFVGRIEKLEANQSIIRAETEKRLEENIKCLRAANKRLEREVKGYAYLYNEIKILQNTFVYAPFWRRLWIALFPAELKALQQRYAATGLAIMAGKE